MQLTANAQPGWSFTGWSGDLSGYENPTNITISANTSINATFGINQYTLTTSATGLGTVAKEPDQSTYAPAQVVRVIPTPATGWRLSSWSGACSGSGECLVTMDGNKSVTANFTMIEYTLTVATSGNGNVNRSPAGPYHYGDIVTLTPVPATGWSFGTWSGDLIGNANPASITIDGNKSITATFTQIEYTLTITTNGEGDVYPNIPAPYHYGDIVQLTASPTSGWVFNNWTGDYSGTANPASITINGNTSITANFTQEEYTLTINIVGKGSVSIDRPGPYHYHDMVIMTATPAPNWSFVGWTGDRVGTANPIAITINNNSSVTATFSGVNVLPDQPTLVAPADASTDISIPPELSVGVSDPDDASLNVSFYGKEPTGASTFTIVALPDTQNYSQYYPAIFTQQTQWIVDNRDTSNIVFVTHEGDVTNNGDNAPAEWVNASTSMYLLDNATPEIPYSIAHGNHDMIGGTTQYNTYFGVSHFQDKPYYGGHYGTNNNHNYELFSAGGMDFIIVHLGYGVGSDANVLNWANTLLQTHSNRRAIVTSHDVMNINGTFTTAGTNIYNALKANTNLFLILCGHNHDEARRSDTYNGHTIYSVLADFQDYPNGGNGWLRIMQFAPAEDLIYFKTYSPYLNQYKTEDKSQFTIPYDMNPPSEFQLIGTNTSVASGSTTSVTWPGLSPQTEYEWYVSVTDPIGTITGPNWTFTTRAPFLYSLTVTKSGDGSGTVTSIPAGISCGSTCSANFTESSIVSLTPTADSGSIFNGWSGACTGLGACSITIDSAKDVEAEFGIAPPESTLTFQQGVGGYAGTQDTYILETSPTSSFGTLDSFEWDTEETGGNANSRKYGLLRFDSIFGSGAGQIPVGSTIVSASLDYTVWNNTTNGPGSLNPALVSWDESTTYNTFGSTAGVQAEDFGAQVADVPAASMQTYSIDVTASLAAWSANPTRTWDGCSPPLEPMGWTPARASTLQRASTPN